MSAFEEVDGSRTLRDLAFLVRSEEKTRGGESVMINVTLLRSLHRMLDHTLKSQWRDINTDPPRRIGHDFQFDVWFGAPDWGWPMMGMVNVWGTPEEWRALTGSLDHYAGKRFEWSLYDQVNDRHVVWDGPEPTLWMARPVWPFPYGETPPRGGAA